MKSSRKSHIPYPHHSTISIHAVPYFLVGSGAINYGDHWQTHTKLATILTKPADFQGKLADQKAIMKCYTQTERNYHRLS